MRYSRHQRYLCSERHKSSIRAAQSCNAANDRRMIAADQPVMTGIVTIEIKDSNKRYESKQRKRCNIRY